MWTLAARDTPFREAVATATAGIVTMIPEGLVLLMSLTFAVGAVRLSRKGMLVQYMNAIESLANVDTVCLDKTGTLTDGNLVLYSVDPLGGAAAEDVAHARVRLRGQRRGPQLDPGRRRRRPAGRGRGHAGGGAVLVAMEVERASAARTAGWCWARRTCCWPAGCRPRCRDTSRRAAGCWPSGAPSRSCPPADGGGGTPRIEPLALVVLEERLRDDAADTIAFLYRQDVDVKVMSGDSPATVAAVAARAGVRVAGTPRQGSDLPEDPAQLADVAREATVFARLTPDNKRALIAALTGHGAYVAMIGDGVNDVPAMKGARLAVALGSGTQLAKSVADSVLVTDRFGAIPDAVGEGRRIINNVQRVAKLFVTKSVFAAFVIATFGLWTAEFPLLPRHLSLAATFTVGVPGFLLALGPGGRTTEQGSFLRRVLRFALPAGAVLGAATLTRLPGGGRRGPATTSSRAAPPRSRCSCSSASTCCWCSRPSACRPADATRPRWWRWPPAWAAASWRCSARRACASSSPWPCQACGRWS